jgi:drug/metabolite transporter (DMT)-like permease
LQTINILNFAHQVIGKILDALQPKNVVRIGLAVGNDFAAGNLLAFAVCAPLALPITQISHVDLLLVLYLGIFQIGLGYLLMTRALRGLPAIEISLLLLIEPVLSSFWAWLVHREEPGAWALAGCATILLATLARILSGPAAAIPVSDPNRRDDADPAT